jgi:hypothetical protein
MDGIEREYSSIPYSSEVNKECTGEGLSDDGCRPAWTEVPPWQARLVPRQDQVSPRQIGIGNEMSRGCHVVVREMFPM